MNPGSGEVSRILAIAAGSGTGAVCRWWMGSLGDGSAWGATQGLLAINAIGAFLIGVLSMQDWSRFAFRTPFRADLLRDAAMNGFCGGFTAFSLFNADLLRTAEHSGNAAALGLAAVSVALWISGVLAGRALGGRVGRKVA